MFDWLVLCFSKASWAEQEQSLRQEMERVREKSSELQSQNTALHQELERVSIDASIISRNMWHV